ncbi:hypothetical protein [Mesorhizobium amorphae]|uniref:hypothetical protein n=1 Tax=Mesorhizobium amorphae TaxID=71433 RepID=UPI001184A63C|nr:hypothetical protein [Mesorhizobium amorphae]
MMQLDLFSAPPLPIPVDRPTVLRVDLGSHSYGQVILVTLDDGTWGYGSDDQFQGYCGHGHGVWPKKDGYPTARDAVAVALDHLHDRWTRLTVDKSSCCTDKHRAAARRGLEWIGRQYLAYGLDPKPERAAA